MCYRNYQYVCGIHVGNKMKWSTFLCTTLYYFHKQYHYVTKSSLVMYLSTDFSSWLQMLCRKYMSMHNVVYICEVYHVFTISTTQHHSTISHNMTARYTSVFLLQT